MCGDEEHCATGGPTATLEHETDLDQKSCAVRWQCDIAEGGNYVTRKARLWLRLPSSISLVVTRSPDVPSSANSPLVQALRLREPSRSKFAYTTNGKLGQHFILACNVDLRTATSTSSSRSNKYPAHLRPSTRTAEQIEPAFVGPTTSSPLYVAPHTTLSCVVGSRYAKRTPMSI
jgi:hypothetical protein